jgi:hypothetical protein
MVEIDFLIIAVVLNANKSDRHKNGFFQRKKTFIDLPLLAALQLPTIESYQPVKLKHFVSILKPNQYYSLYLTKDKKNSWSELILDEIFTRYKLPAHPNEVFFPLDS